MGRTPARGSKNVIAADWIEHRRWVNPVRVGTGGGSESCLQHPGNQRAPWNVKTGLHLTARRREAGRTGIGPQVQLRRQGEELLVSLELHPDSFHHSLLFSLV